MSTALALIHDAALAASIGTALYTATVTTAALTALLAPPRHADATPAKSSPSCCAARQPRRSPPTANDKEGQVEQVAQTLMMLGCASGAPSPVSGRPCWPRIRHQP